LSDRKGDGGKILHKRGDGECLEFELEKKKNVCRIFYKRTTLSFRPGETRKKREEEGIMSARRCERKHQVLRRRGRRTKTSNMSIG